jgi:activator of HSP90 ATPase
VNTIQQTVDFSATPAQLFEIYMDSKKHSQATLAKATMSRKAGGRFTAFDGMLAGRNLIVIPNQLIVQAWRATHWKKTDPDSILVLKFSKTKGGGRVELVHTNVPDHDYLGVKKGWPHYYWKPWRAHLKKNS